VLIRLGIILHHRRLCWKRLFTVIAVFGLLSTQANAASFDCNKAVSWLEKTVCSNPELSKLDEELAKAYHDALASLSPEGQKETRQYQRQWLKDILPKCKKDNQGISVRCLKYNYNKRIKQLQQSLLKFPDHIFINVSATHQETDEDCPGEIATKELTYPQIENPRNENEKFWNTFISQKARNELKIDDGCTDTYVEYTVIFSNKYTISLLNGRSSAPHGSGRAFQFTTSVCWLLEAKRELQVSDLFDDKAGWRYELVELVSDKLQEKIPDDEETFSKALSWKSRSWLTSPGAWVISKNGLGFGFLELYLEGFRFFITIDWKALDPYLSKNGRSLIYD
jgi:uncharacterized protein